MRPRRFYAPAPTPSHCVCLIPTDANDYKISPGGVGAAAGLSLPDNATDVEYFWDFWQQIYWIRYNLADVNGTIQPHIRFQTDVNSTQAHLHTATDMGLTRVGFWVLKQPAYPNCKSAKCLFAGVVVCSDLVAGVCRRNALPTAVRRSVQVDGGYGVGLGLPLLCWWLE